MQEPRRAGGGKFTRRAVAVENPASSHRTPFSISDDRTTTWLITGASGLLGHALCRHLTAGPGNRVVGQHAGHAIEVPGVESVTVDLLDDAALDRMIDEAGADVIVHCAALANVDACERDPDLGLRDRF